MVKRMRRFALAAVVAGTVLVPAVPSYAAPINCPDGQTAVKTSSGWDCQNQGGNTNQSEDPKNPNAGKGFF